MKGISRDDFGHGHSSEDGGHRQGTGMQGSPLPLAMEGVRA